MRKLTPKEKEKLQTMLDKHRAEQIKKRQEFLQYKADLRRRKGKAIANALSKPHS